MRTHQPPSPPQAQKCAIKVEIVDERDVTKLKGVIAGPPDTPFEGEMYYFVPGSSVPCDVAALHCPD